MRGNMGSAKQFFAAFSRESRVPLPRKSNVGRLLEDFLLDFSRLGFCGSIFFKDGRLCEGEALERERLWFGFDAAKTKTPTAPPSGNFPHPNLRRALRLESAFGELS